MRYTQGNWTATRKEGNYIIHSDQSNNGCLAIVGTGLYNSDPTLINEAEANAKLIAAAPNMLYLIQCFKIAADKNFEGEDAKYWADQCNKLITKATL